MALLICKICEEEFNPTHPKHIGGHYSVCGVCDKYTEPIKTLGMIVAVGKTDVGVQIVRNAQPHIAAFIKKQGKCGPSHCHGSLGLSSSGASTPKDKMDGVQSKLYGE